MFLRKSQITFGQSVRFLIANFSRSWHDPSRFSITSFFGKKFETSKCLNFDFPSKFKVSSKVSHKEMSRNLHPFPSNISKNLVDTFLSMVVFSCISISGVINHMTYYKFERFQWWKIYSNLKFFTRFSLQSECYNFNQ